MIAHFRISKNKAGNFSLIIRYFISFKIHKFYFFFKDAESNDDSVSLADDDEEEAKEMEAVEPVIFP